MPKRKLKWVHLESGAVLHHSLLQPYTEAFDLLPEWVPYTRKLKELNDSKIRSIEELKKLDWGRETDQWVPRRAYHKPTEGR